jgi:carbamoyltransferase
MDLAASIQKVTEEIMLRMSRHVHKVTGQQRLCLAGGVALNCVGNGRILREGPFKEIWIQPASGDAGAALGAALLVWYKYFNNARFTDENQDSQKASFLGPSYSDEEIEEFLLKEGAPYKRLAACEIPNVVSGLIAEGKVIGWFEGALEFGPRALGSRSIIADARNSEMQSKMNLKIKYRESFRPFAPSVLSEHVSEYFDLDRESPYMLLVAPVKESKRLPLHETGDLLNGFGKLKIKRSVIPAVTHVDYSARIQTIKRDDHPLYYDTIDAFYGKTGCPVIINTSFNVRGEPLVCTPQDAFRCFMRTEMDYLVMGSFLLDKKEQRKVSKDTKWQQVFELD